MRFEAVVATRLSGATRVTGASVATSLPPAYIYSLEGLLGGGIEGGGGERTRARKCLTPAPFRQIPAMVAVVRSVNIVTTTTAPNFLRWRLARFCLTFSLFDIWLLISRRMLLNPMTGVDRARLLQTQQHQDLAPTFFQRLERLAD